MPPGPPFDRICRYGLVNCYLLEEEDGLTVIDTALPGTATNLAAAAEARGKPITRIVLTHAHSDHVGALDALAARFPEAEVVISTREAKLLAGDKSLEESEPQQSVKGGFPKISTRPTSTVAGGDRIGSLEVFETPGHTPGQIALLDERDRTLYCGDAFTTIGGIATPAKLKKRFPLPYLATWDKQLALRSSEQLLTVDPARLAPGHGKVIEHPGPGMAAAVRAAGG